MRRDDATGKTQYTRVFDGPMLDRWAEHLTRGAEHYEKERQLGDPPNWMKAEGLAEWTAFRESATRHFRKWLRGDTDEDHAAALFFNVNGAEYVEERMRIRGEDPH